MSISLLYCLDGDTTTVQVRNKHTLVEEDITLRDLYIRIHTNALTDNSVDNVSQQHYQLNSMKQIYAPNTEYQILTP